MRRNNQSTGRLEARLPNAVLDRLKRAAEIQGRTLTDFVVAAADEAPAALSSESRSFASPPRTCAKSLRRF